MLNSSSKLKNKDRRLIYSSIQRMPATKFIEQAGGKVIVPPFDIQIGRCAVLEDPWGNPLVLLDTSKGLLKTDAAGNVTGNMDPIIDP